MTERRTVGYARTFQKSSVSIQIQKKMILDYCARNDLECAEWYEDCGYCPDRPGKAMKIAEQIGLPQLRWTHVFSGWEAMMSAMIKGEIGKILVDTKFRLFSGEIQKEVLMNLCNKHNVEIIEVGQLPPNGESRLDPRVVFYYCSNEPQRRISVVLNAIDKSYDFLAKKYAGGTIGLYLDEGFSGRTNRNIALNEQAAVLAVKKFHHINRHVSSVMETAMLLADRGEEFISTEDGGLRFLGVLPKEMDWKRLRIAGYEYCVTPWELPDLSIKRFKSFIAQHCSGSDIVDVFIDTGQNSRTQREKLLDNQDRYDIILVTSYSKLCRDSIELVKICKMTKIPIFSLKEGVVEVYEP